MLTTIIQKFPYWDYGSQEMKKILTFIYLNNKNWMKKFIQKNTLNEGVDKRYQQDPENPLHGAPYSLFTPLKWISQKYFT